MAITSMVVVPSGSVAADQVSSLRAQAKQLAQDLVLEQLQLSTYQQQYEVDAARVQRDQQAIASTESQIRADADRVSRDRARLQSEAVSAYIHLNPEINQVQALFDNGSSATVRSEYEKVASGDIALTIATLHTDENQLSTQHATLVQQEARDQATTNQEVTLTNSSRQTAATLESKQSQVTGQLAVAVAQQQAAQAAAAAAAIRKAQAAAAAAAAAQTSRTTVPSTGVTVLQGAPVSFSASGNPALPPFLQCVLQAESSGNYQAVSPDGTYMGGFQFSQPTWNQAAQLAGMPQLVNVPPNTASPADQDDLAIALYQADGEQPWNDSCRS